MNKYFLETDPDVIRALEILGKESLLALDTETSGLDCRTCRLWSVQIATREDSFLFPYSAMPEYLKDKLRIFLADKTIIAHNAKFDLSFLLENGFQTGKVYCTQEAEKYLYAGKYFSWGLKDVLKRRFQIDMDKAPRKDFYDGVFAERVGELGHIEAWTEELVEYALEDVAYLHEIYDAQTEDARELGMDNVMWLENSLVPVVAKMERRGVRLDAKAVKKFLSKVLLRRDELKKDLFEKLEKSYNVRWQKEYGKRMALWDVWQKEHKELVLKTNSMRHSDNKRKKSDEALKMVEDSNKKKPFSQPPKQSNPFLASSPTKLCLALSELTGLNITTTNKDWLEENIDLHPAIADLTEFRKFEKLVQFCELTEDINPATGRVHASFNQNGARSGRFSCSDPNCQQIPSRSEEGKEFRALFVAREGYKWVGSDFAGIELVILAYFAKEHGLLETINSGMDVHCYTMSQLLSASYATLMKAREGGKLSQDEDSELTAARQRFESSFAMTELKKQTDHTSWVKKLRDYVKTITYGLSYGLSAWGASRKFHCAYEDAEKLIKIFFASYPNLRKFLSSQETLGYERGYAVNPLGRRRWFSRPYMQSYQQIEESVIKSLDKQKRLWDSVSDDEWQMLMHEATQLARKEYTGKINAIKRQAGNLFPQSICADMIKLAMYRFNRDFKGDETEGLILTIHDELWAECREDNVELCKQHLEQSMDFAVKKFLPEITTKVEAVVSDHWIKS